MAKSTATYLRTRSTVRSISDFINPAYAEGVKRYISDLRSMNITAYVEGSTLVMTGARNCRISELPSAYCI